MLAFIREPVPPARTRKPVDPKPVNSALLDADDWSADEVAVFVWVFILAAVRGPAPGAKAAENGNSNRN